MRRTRNNNGRTRNLKQGVLDSKYDLFSDKVDLTFDVEARVSIVSKIGEVANPGNLSGWWR